MFELKQISFGYPGGLAALHPLDLKAERGERIAVIGPSGAGKTSLLRLLGASLRPDRGEMRLLGCDPWALSAAGLRHLRSQIGMVHQNPPLPARQRVITAVLAGRLGQWPFWKSLLSLLYPQDIPGATRVLAQLDLEGRCFQRCDHLSGGQLQRVGVARVLYQQPGLILADEPVSALDPALALQTLRVLAEAARQQRATLVASLHSVELALAEFPRIVGLRQGRLAFDLPARAVTAELLAQLYAGEGGEQGGDGPHDSVGLVGLPRASAGQNPLFCSSAVT